MLVLGYWLSIYSAVALCEHFIFRRSYESYDLTAYGDRKRLPIGLAAFAAGLFGWAGAVVGMSQSWFIGPIGNANMGLFGGDVGWLLALLFTTVTYPPFRWLELKFVGR